MLAAWMAYATLLTSLLALGALAAERVAGIWRGGQRFVWLAALLVAIVVPVVLATRPPSPTPERSSATPIVAPAAPRTGVRPLAAAPRGAAVRARLADDARRVATQAEPYLRGVWLAASAALLAIYLGAMLRLRHQSSQWREIDLDGARVHVAPDAGPAVVSALRPRIVIPAWALSLDDRRRTLMLRHEAEHIRAHDPQMLLVAALSLLLFPWNAALWIVARRLRLAIEVDCDRRVLRAFGDSREYAMLLLAVGAQRSVSLPFAPALAERQPLLERRIRAMTEPRPRSPLLTSLALTGFVVLATTAASKTPRPAPVRALVAPATTIHGMRSRDAALALAPEAGRQTLRGNAQDAGRVQGTPRVTVSWENAPIDEVIAAFAKFSGRTIRASKNVTGTIRANIVDQPWDVALTSVMNVNGYEVTFNPDRTITIAPRMERTPKPSERPGLPTAAPAAMSVVNDPLAATPSDTRAQTREITGKVSEDVTGQPIRDAEVAVVGALAIGEPNRTCTNDRGEFQLRVPTGEVWLDARAAGFEFRRATLGPTDTTADFRGKKLPALVLVDNLPVRDIESVEVVKGAAAVPLYGARAANGVITIRTKGGDGAVKFFGQTAALNQPLLIVDGVVVPNGMFAVGPAGASGVGCVSGRLK